MAAATTQLNTPGRGPSPFCNLSFASVTITATATTYTSASGGLPFDLTTILQNLAPSGWNGPAGIQAINPNDIVGVLFPQLTTSGNMPLAFTLGTPTYTTPPGQSTNDESANPGFLATCPCTIRIYQTGSGNQQPFAELANGAVTDAITILLVINRNGANS